MQRITREQAKKYAFNWQDEPLLRVKPGWRLSNPRKMIASSPGNG